MKRSRPESLWGRSKGSPTGNRIFIQLISRFGVTPAYALAAFVSLRYALCDRASADAIRSFRTRLGLPTHTIHLWRHFYYFAVSLIDRLAFLLERAPEFSFETSGKDNFIEALSPGRGLIVVSAHVGNWELAGNMLAEEVPTRVNVVMRDAERPEIRRILETATKRRRVTVIPAGEDSVSAMIPIRRALERAEIVCMLGDRRWGSREKKVPFLGAPASFPAGPWEIAAILGSPILPLFVRKCSRRGYSLTVHPAEHPAGTGTLRKQAIAESMAHFVNDLELFVSRYPFEWHNFHDFWAA